MHLYINGVNFSEIKKALNEIKLFTMKILSKIHAFWKQKFSTTCLNTQLINLNYQRYVFLFKIDSLIIIREREGAFSDTTE